MNKLYQRSYFFDKGLFFECQQCGCCCTGDPGFVYVYPGEAVKIAKYLSMSVSIFVEKFLYPYNEGYSIREYEDGRCFFYQEGCTVYPVRPGQCRTFPFWFENLRSSKKWQQVSKECPGIGRGRLYSKEQVLEIVHSTFADHIQNIINAA